MDIQEKAQNQIQVMKGPGDWLCFGGMVCLLAMVVLTTLDVFLRFIFNRSIPGTLPLCEMFLIVVVYLGLPFAELRGSHVRVEVLFAWLSSVQQKRMVIFDQVISIGVLILLTYASISNSIMKYIKGEVKWMGTKQFPMWPPRLFLAIGVTAFLIILIIEARKPKIVSGEKTEGI